ncbi:hypothetical protein NM688_g8131 [Phlebia brevispora]|uniref:Uncharacterized protein n=1 Tax=Phlebia brevispora TaxID=194682 RepID=A0ACC1RWX0_9APHY|nr:hypothetical protein NM688_g8131 [Phlebia brevispora]
MDSQEQLTLNRRCHRRGDCENAATMRCSGCKKVWYCSAHCQRVDWTFHIFHCRPNIRIRSSYHLIRACCDDLLPTDPQTLVDYGFARLNDGHDTGMLLGVYQGLYLIQAQRDELDPRALDKWMREGSLVQHIKDAFEQLPPEKRGGYYAWFLQNQWVLDGSPIPIHNTARAVADRMEKTLWDVLGPTRKAQLATWPTEKKICVLLYRGLLSDFHPSPINSPEEYISFGFCVARGLYAEMVIARLYKQLLSCCLFEEFCDAFEGSSLIALMEKHNVISHRDSLPRHFEHVMRSRLTHESVWDLKQYLYGENKHKLAPAVLVDYGFINCKQPDELHELTAVYKVAFDHEDFDEMELHGPCVRGQVLEYIGRFQTLSKEKKQKLVRLMQPSA